MISISWARDMRAMRMLLMTMRSTVRPTKASTMAPRLRSRPGEVHEAVDARLLAEHGAHEAGLGLEQGHHLARLPGVAQLDGEVGREGIEVGTIDAREVLLALRGTGGLEVVQRLLLADEGHRAHLGQGLQALLELVDGLLAQAVVELGAHLDLGFDEAQAGRRGPRRG